MPSSFAHHMPSPSPDPQAHPRIVAQDYRPQPSAATMLKIHSLLNPTSESSRWHPHHAGATPPPTPAHTTHGSSPAGTPRPGTPATPSASKRQKLVKDAAVFLRGSVKGDINHPPFECNEESLDLDLNHEQRQELAEQHQRFQIFPSGRGDEGRIADYVRHIPYSSEKKNFLNKTGRDAFDGRFMLAFHPHARPLLICVASLPIYLLRPQRSRQARPRGHVGLQGRPRAHHAVFQSVQVLEGKYHCAT